MTATSTGPGGVPAPTEANDEIGPGRPGSAGRRLLGAAALVALAGFVVNSALVLSGATLIRFDAPLTQLVQSVSWGPLVNAMTMTNFIGGGVVAEIVGVAIVFGVFIYDRRAGLLLALGALGSLWVQLLKESIARQRPTADVVHILNPASGFSYPSGHAVFFTWLAFMLAAGVSPRLSRSWRAVPWGLAGLVIFTACLGRVWAGVHWPTDVIGAFLLGVAWSAFVLWIPVRWLPTPKPPRLSGAGSP